MDDVWGNAWSQSEAEDGVAHNIASTSKLDDIPTWSLSPLTTPKHVEADVGTPSWSSGELNWTEPIGQASLWASAPADDDVHMDAWTTSLRTNNNERHEYDKNDTTETPIATTNDTEIDAVVDVPKDLKGLSRSSTPRSAETVQPQQALTVTSAKDESDINPVDEHEPRPVSPDGFGGFASVVPSVVATDIPSNDAWSSPEFDSSADSWGSAAWASAGKDEGTAERVKDEWEIAKEEKARRDRTVPPELLAAILDNVNSLMDELWTENPYEGYKEDLGSWRNGIQNIDGLEDLRSQYIPETRIQPPIMFGSTRIAKESVQSIKLSKNLPVVRNSPMSHLFTTKSLAAWELSVRAKSYDEKDDTPVGWKSPEIEEKEPPRPSVSEKKSGGILSFFSKRASTPTPAAAVTETKRASITSHTRQSSESSVARASTDKQPTTSKQPEAGSSLPVSVTSPPLPSSSSSSLATKYIPSPPNVAPPAEMNRTSSEPDSPPAPSVLSKFFNRFSRTRSDGGSRPSSPRSSLALSSNDLEFLSDIVPRYSEDAGEGDALNALSSFVSSPPIPERLPPALSPPPLAPPNRAPSMSLQAGSSHSRSRSQTPLIDEPNSSFQSQRLTGLMADLSILSPSKPIQSAESPTPTSMSPVNRQRNDMFDLLQPDSGNLPRTQLSSGVPKGVFNSTPHKSDSSKGTPTNSIPPTPIEKSPARIRQPVQPTLMEDDEFSDFQSYSDPLSTAASKPSSNKIDMNPNEASHPTSRVVDDFFGDFSEFVNNPASPTSTHTPVSPLSPDVGVPPPLPKKQTPAPLTSLLVHKPSAADHDSTARLVEKAASRQGRWPAPPSPLPQALSPPSRPMNSSPPVSAQTPPNDIRLPPPPRQSIPLKSIAQITATSLSRSSSPAPISAPSPSGSPAPPPPSASDLDSLLDFASPPSQAQNYAAPIKTAASPMVGTSANGKGLSAQDLSFFEGL